MSAIIRSPLLLGGPIGGTHYFGDGTAAAPSITFLSDTDTGIYRPGSDQVGIALNGALSCIFTTTGVGVGAATPSSKLDVTTAGLGVTQTTTSGLALVNTTAAAAGAQQISPALRFSGFGWKTNATAASQAVDFRAYVLPVQGAAAPTGNLIFQSSINGGAYSDLLTLSSGGNGTLAGNLTVSGTGANTFVGDVSVSNASTNGTNYNLVNSDTGGATWSIGTAGSASATGDAVGTFYLYQGGATKFALAKTTGNATFAGNLTVSGTGTHTFGTTNTVTMAAGLLTQTVAGATSAYATYSANGVGSVFIGQSGGANQLATGSVSGDAAFRSPQRLFLCTGGATPALTLETTGAGTLAGSLTAKTFLGEVEAKSGAGALNVTQLTTKWTTTAADAGTLADGTAGQVKIITMVSDGGDGTLTPTTKTGFTTITFNDVGDSAILQFHTTLGWMILANYGCTVA